MKHGLRTTEFWFGVLLAIGLYALVWFQRFPAHGTAGYEGVQDLMIIWGAYTGYRGFLKKGKPNEETNPTPTTDRT